MSRFVALGLSLGLVLTACTDAAPSGRTAPEPQPIASTTTVVSNGRTLEIVGCNDAPQEAEIVCEAYDLIHTEYVDPVLDEDLAAGAAQGLELLDGAVGSSRIVCVAPSEEFVEVCSLAPEEAESTTEAAEAMLWGMASFALDPNSAYLDEALLKLIKDDQDGEVEGIGALVTTEDRSSGEAEQCGVLSETCRLIIVSPIAGSPAEASGIEQGDVILRVDGLDLNGWTIDDVTAIVRGRAGTDVTLTILRGEQTLDITITRAAVEIPVVTTEVVGSAGYVRLSQFTENADEQLQEAIFDLLTEGIETLVLDLRDNPGGLLTTAISVTSQFLPDGDVVETRSPESTRTYEVEGSPIVPENMKVIVVVNRGSASASELLSAVLQERGRATIVGENTFGKNTVQEQFELSNGSAMKLTVARWVTPRGLDFGEVGVTPDTLEEFPVDLTIEAIVELALSLS